MLIYSFQGFQDFRFSRSIENWTAEFLEKYSVLEYDTKNGGCRLKIKNLIQFLTE